MKKKKIVALFLLFTLNLGNTFAQTVPDQKETLKTTILVNDYFMKKYADCTTPTYVGKLRSSNLWTHAYRDW